MLPSLDLLYIAWNAGEVPEYTEADSMDSTFFTNRIKGIFGTQLKDDGDTEDVGINKYPEISNDFLSRIMAPGRTRPTYTHSAFNLISLQDNVQYRKQTDARIYQETDAWRYHPIGKILEQYIEDIATAYGYNPSTNKI